jgi:hypothetical protein
VIEVAIPYLGPPAQFDSKRGGVGQNSRQIAEEICMKQFTRKVLHSGAKTMNELFQ